MNSEVLCEIITDAWKRDKAVKLYINNIHEQVTIEPDMKTDLLGDVLKIKDDLYVLTDQVIMVQITMNEKERNAHIKELFDEFKRELK